MSLVPHPVPDDGLTLWEKLEHDPWRAGRLMNRPPRTSPDETSAVIHRFHSQNWLSGFDLPPGAPTAQETMKTFQRDRLAPALRELGFRGSGSKFRLAGDHEGYVSVTRHRHSNRLVVAFTLGLSVGWPIEKAFWSTSLAYLLQTAGQVDCWWRLPAGANTDQLLEDVVTSLRTYGLPVLEAAMADLPPSPAPDRNATTMSTVEAADAARESLSAAARQFRSVRLSSRLRGQGWSEVEVEKLALYFEQLADSVSAHSHLVPTRYINVVELLTSSGVDPSVGFNPRIPFGDELAGAARRAAGAFNTYVRRSSVQ